MPSPTRPPPQRFNVQRGLTHEERRMAGIPTRPNGGRPLKPAELARRLALRAPTQADLEEAAKALGYESAEHARLSVAEADTRQALVMLLVHKMALRGNQWAIQNLLDRWLPKPRRVELAGPGGGAIPLTAVPAGAVGAGSREAADYFASLEAPPLGEGAEAEDAAADAGYRGSPTGFEAEEIIDVEALTPDPSGEDLL